MVQDGSIVRLERAVYGITESGEQVIKNKNVNSAEYIERWN